MLWMYAGFIALVLILLALDLVGQHFNLYLLAVVLLILAAGVGASLLVSRRERATKDSDVRPNAA